LRHKFGLDDSVFNETESNSDASKLSMNAAAKRKGSFKKWLRSSHRKFTSNSSSGNAQTRQNGAVNSKMENGGGAASKYLNLTTSSDLAETLKNKKLLSNSEDLNIKKWMVEEESFIQDELQEQEEKHFKSNSNTRCSLNEFNDTTTTPTTITTTTMTQDKTMLNHSFSASNSVISNNDQTSGVGTNDDDVEDLSFIPPPMNVIKAEQAEQSSNNNFEKVTVSSFSSKIPNQSIDIQRELKIWQSKMENSKKIGNNNTNNNSSLNIDSSFNINNSSIEFTQNQSSSFKKASHIEHLADCNPQIEMSTNSNSNNNGSTSTPTPPTDDTNNSLEELPPPPPTPPPIQHESKLTYAIKELLNTEIDYVNDLAILIDKFMEAIKANELVPMPQDMEGGKDKIVFGNIQQIYEWHKSTFSPDIEKCLTEPTAYIGQLFVKYENRFQMYVKYCENKPKSEYIIGEYDIYFEELRLKLNSKLNIQDLLIKPVQRIMKYQLMLKEIKKYMHKEQRDCKSIDRAIEIMVTVPKNADDMMNVGRLQGFEGRITAQGRLLMQDTVLVQEPSDEATGNKKKKDTPVKLKERRVFLFQQIIIFSEMIGSSKKFTSPRYIFKSDMKVNKLQFQKDDASLCFTLLDKTPESNKKIVCQCEDTNKYANWIAQLQDLLDMQSRFLRDLQHPQLAMQTKQQPQSHSLAATLATSSSVNNNTPASSKTSEQQQQQQHHHQNPLSQFNDFLKSTFNFSNSSTTTAYERQRTSNSVMSAAVAISPLVSPNNIKGIKSSISPNNNNNNNSVDNLNSELIQHLKLETPPTTTTTTTTNDSTTNSNIPNCAKVINSYAAITEDEITVQKGDIVQIITANMHNRFLVHRESSELQPAAEGWIPGFVIGFSQSANST
jgi:hypothetical protein